MNDRGEVVAEVLRDDGRIERERIRERENEHCQDLERLGHR